MVGIATTKSGECRSFALGVLASNAGLHHRFPSSLLSVIRHAMQHQAPPMNDQQAKNLRRLAVAGGLLALWLLASWLIASAVLRSRAADLVHSQADALERQATNLSHNVANSLDQLHGIPVLIASDLNVAMAVSRFDAASETPPERRKQLWSADATLKDLNRHFGLASKALGMDVLWLTNSEGDCIASSNADQPDSFVGMNYADRRYFQMAMAGGQGYQYAMGRATNIPGLFFSAPVMSSGHAVGVVTVKINLPKLSYWINQADAFITDDFGVVVLARDASLEMRSLPNAAINELDQAQRQARYKRTNFPPLAMQSWGDPRFTELQRFADEPVPVLMTHRSIAGDGINVHVVDRLARFAELEHERLDLFLLLAATGSIALLIVRSSLYFARMRKQAALEMARSVSLLRATIESTTDGILVVDQAGQLTTYNQRFVELWRIPPELQEVREDKRLIEFVSEQLANPQQFIQKVIELYEQPDQVSHDTLQFRDGRVFERDSYPQRLGDKVVGRVWNFRDITSREAAEEQIRTLAFYDSLTQLPNRRLLLDRLSQAMVGGERRHNYGAVMFLDLDNFKTLNDTQGHDVGDLLLVEVAHRLRTCLRECDTVSRFGGDEFVILLEDLGAEDAPATANAEVVADKIQAALAQPLALQARNGRTVQDFIATASIGICTFLGHEMTADELLKRADLAMYQAKTSGRNTSRFLDTATQAALEARTALESELRHAITRGELQLYFQVQLDRDECVVGAEALLRWNHPTRGLVPPVEFIPLAEETGLIVPIGMWALEAACIQLAAWAGDPARSRLKLAVNLSPRQFRQVDMVTQVKEVLSRTSADPNRLSLELTESVVIDNIEETNAKMKELKALGISFALDDFGTGSSSLAYLKRLPLDQLKIDRSFVMDLERNENDAAICAGIISLAHNLRLQVVAEGVETEAQRHFLSVVHKCDFLQGYLLGRPAPAADFEIALNRRNVASSTQARQRERGISPFCGLGDFCEAESRVAIGVREAG
jgi:diguanylate cyclase (GGDEF)-like protein/PAS domain S-box-containing protein